MNKFSNKTEILFGSLGEIIVKYRWIFILTITAIFIFSLLGLPKLKMDTSTENWFLEGAKIVTNKKEFEKNFNNNEIVACLINADDIFTHEILTMINELGKDFEGEIPFAHEIISITDVEYTYVLDDDNIVIEDLIPEPIPQSREELEQIRKKALSETAIVDRIISRDSKRTWLILRLYEYDKNWAKEHNEEPENAIGRKVFEILEREKYKKYDIKPTGMPVMGYQQLVYTQKETSRILLFSLIIVLIFLIVFFRSVTKVLIPFITTIVSIFMVFGIMGHLEIKINAYLATVPVVLALAISLGYTIHIFNYFNRHFIETGKRRESVIFAVGKAGWPLFFTALTTIAALISFLIIRLQPLQWLGLTCAALILTVYILTKGLAGALLSFGKDKKIETLKPETKFKTDKYFVSLGSIVQKNALVIIICFSVLIVVMIFGLTKLEVNMDNRRTYGMKLDHVRQAVEIAETDLGSFGSYNITLQFQQTDTVKDPQVLTKFSELESTIQSYKLTKRTNSIIEIVKDMNRLINGDDIKYYTIPQDKNLIAQLFLLYDMSGGGNLDQWVNSDFTLLRLLVETKDLNAKETLIELENIRSLINKAFPAAKLNISGSTVDFAAINQYVAQGQITSLFFALTVISILLIIVFKSIKVGLIGIIPNITPIIIVGGVMGFAGIPLDYVTVTLIPMILGLAVDDTIHFITHFKTEYLINEDYTVATQKTLKIVGSALFMTSFIIIVSFLVYLSSSINMLFNIGVFLILGIGSALITDYLMTPILLRYFKTYKKSKKSV